MDTNNPSSSPTPPRKRSFKERGLYWPLGLACMFLVSASFVLVTAILGAGKGSRAVEPDYYARSLNWDSEKEHLKTAQRLGWDIQLTTGPTLDPYGTRMISVVLLDTDASPLEGSLVELVCFSQSNAHAPFSKVLPSAGPGQYQAQIKGMHTAGMWEFRIAIRHAGEQALVVKSIEIEG